MKIKVAVLAVLFASCFALDATAQLRFGQSRMALAYAIKDAKVSDWKAATTLERVAAADAMAISYLMNQGYAKPPDKLIDPLSRELRVCLDEATQARGMDHQPLRDFAALCMMGIVK